MAERTFLSKETFLYFASRAGLDVDSPHIDDLHAFIKGLLPILETSKDLDLSGLEPFVPSWTGGINKP